MTQYATKLPGLSLLGWSYDIRGEIASADSTLKCVIPSLNTFMNTNIDPDSTTTSGTSFITIGSSSYCYPTTCSVDVGTSSQSYTVYGSSFSDYASSYGGHFGISGKYGAFSGSLSMDFSNSARSTSDYQYYSIFDRAQYWMVRVTDPSSLTLDSSFSSALNDTTTTTSGAYTTDAKTLFNTWGTHIVTGVIVGGTRMANYYSSTKTYTTEQSFSGHANAKYNSMVGSVRMDASGYSDDSSTEQNVLSETSETIVGGNVALTNWDDWAATVPTYPAVVDFIGDGDLTDGSTGLIPIWELCTDATRQTYLQEQFESLYQLSWVQSDIVMHYAPTSDQRTNWNSSSPTSASEGTSQANLLSFRLDYDLAAAQLSKNGWSLPSGSSSLYTLVISGFGARVDKKGHVTRIAVQVTDVNTGTTQWYSKGDTTTYNQTNFELQMSAPSGMILTGLGVREQDNNLQNMGLYYQTLDDSAKSQCYLGTNINAGYLSRSGSTGTFTGFEQNYNPGTNNTYALVGIEVKCAPGKFDTLNVLQAKLGRNIDR